MRITCANLALFCLLALVLAGCGASRKQPPTEASANTRPVAVMVEREISGHVLGQALRAPWGLAADRRGSLYLADGGNNRVIAFDDRLLPVRDAGGYGSEQGLMDRPSYLTVDNDLNLWVSDVGNKRICRFDNKLNYVDEIELYDAQDPLKFGTPSGIAVTGYGEVWMCDRETHRLVVFDNIGRFDRFLGDFGYSGGSMRNPEKILLGRDGDFYVCDAGSRRVAVFDEYGTFQRELADEQFSYPCALAFDSSGVVWVLDSGTNLLYGLDGQGHELLVMGPLLPGTSLPMKNPTDLLFTRDGLLVISDSGNNRLLICRVAYTGR